MRDLLALQPAVRSVQQAAIEPPKQEPAVPMVVSGIGPWLLSQPRKPHPNWWATLEEPQIKELSPAEALTDAITGTIEVDSWTTNGGEGSLRVYGGLLIVTHNDRIQADVVQLLSELRKANAEQTAEATPEK